MKREIKSHWKDVLQAVREIKKILGTFHEVASL